MILTQSSIGTLRACPRKYRLRYIDRLRRKRDVDYSHPLDFGALFHEVLERHYRRDSADPVSSSLAMRQHVDEHLDERLSEGAPEEQIENYRAIFHAMVDAYLQRWRMGLGPDTGEVVDADFSIEAVEMAFRHEYPDAHFAGKVDALIRLQSDGRLYIMEHKTLAHEGDVSRLWTDFQIQSYARAIHLALGEPVVGALYNMVIKPRLRRKVETDEAFAKRLARYKRPETIAKHRAAGPNTESLAAFRARVDGFFADPMHLRRELVLFDARDLREVDRLIGDAALQVGWREADRYWPQYTGSCYVYGRECEFAPICQAGGELDEITSQWYESRPEHPELESESTENREEEEIPF